MQTVIIEVILGANLFFMQVHVAQGGRLHAYNLERQYEISNIY